MWEDVHILEDEDKRRLERFSRLKEFATEEDRKLLCEELVYDYVAHLLSRKSRDVARKRDHRLLLSFLQRARKRFLKEGKEESRKFEPYAKAAADYLALQEAVTKDVREWLRFEKVDENEWLSYLRAFARLIVQD